MASRASTIHESTLSKTAPKVNGEHVLYHYLQKDLQENDGKVFEMLTARLITSLGIWFALHLYDQLPTILPFVVRDPTCRKKVGGTEQWGAPNALGYFRDDNSLVKALPNSLNIVSPRVQYYDGRRIGNGFVASHVWRQIAESQTGASLASRDPWTNSFVPNLVWLPKQVSKLTDREGSFPQRFLQALSRKIFGQRQVATGLRNHVARIWAMLPEPDIPFGDLPALKELSFFEPTDRFLQTRLGTIQAVVEALKRSAARETLTKKVVSSRYTEGLGSVSTDALVRLGGELSRYVDLVRDVTSSGGEAT